ncbi:DUF6528 family protein [Paenibacillus solisilvae]|uniref:DUF6528 family protein n=1 Tax=Paenibacillus solisilvae TaxID=2486751 RepID=A0ABW0VTI6_9BACL
MPQESNGFQGLTSLWGLPTEARVREVVQWGGVWMAVTDSKGLAAIIPYPQGDSRKWGLEVGGNPHAAELLPNGNIAVAASTGGWIRVYASSQGPDDGTYAEYGLPGAHAVLWDLERKTLWAAGSFDIVELAVEGTDAEPVLTERMKAQLPTKHAHDVQSVAGSPDKLWVATGSKVYQYSKSTGKFDLSYEGSAGISRVGVKSVGSLPDGRVVETVTDTAKTPPGPCTANNWCTDTIDFFQPDGSRSERRIQDSELYKARVLNPGYE